MSDIPNLVVCLLADVIYRFRFGLYSFRLYVYGLGPRYPWRDTLTLIQFEQVRIYCMSSTQASVRSGNREGLE